MTVAHLAATAWKPYQPSAANPWDLRKVGHLYRRASFGADWETLQTALKAGPDQAIDQLLAGGDGLDRFEADSQRLAEPIIRANNNDQAQAWWLYRMLYTPHPLREKLTLFWHNHFATSNAKVQNIRMMLGQYDLLARHALGHFGPMLQEMSQDPAMLVWLDTAGSKKGMPNENYARELMELFSLGIGNYTEADIREAARAFTGWEIRNGEAFLNEKQFDAGTKKVLGKQGNFKAPDIVDICLTQPACPRFLVGKLYRYLISEAVPATPELIDPLAEQFRASDFNIAKLVETMLRSNLFFSPKVYRSRVKAPVDFALGIVRGLEGRIGTTALATALQSLGQTVFNPPSVKGWDGGRTWLNGQTLLFRQNLARDLTSTENPQFGTRCDPAALIRQHGIEADDAVVNFLLDLFLQGDVAPDTRHRLVSYMKQSKEQTFPVYWSSEDIANHRLRAVSHLVLSLPEFQLD